MVSAQRIMALGFVILSCVFAWLLSSAWLVNIDYDDGYNTITNSQFLLGITPDYDGNRGLGFALLLMPAEYLANLFSFKPFDVRLHHLTMALLHFAFIYFTWAWMVRKFGHTLPVVLAFVMAMLTYIFFSYAPFISHDLFPGILLLAMLKLAERYQHTPKCRYFALLVFLGAAAALIKQTYAIFWVAIVVSVFITDGVLLRKIHGRYVGSLLLGAGLSGLITWVGYSLSTGFNTLHETAFWLRPIELITRVSGAYANSAVPVSDTFPWWLYLRNFSAYGLGAMLMIIPALYVNLKSKDRLQIMIAISWIVCVLFLQLMTFKEVRYLAFLAPLTAFLLVPLMLKLRQINQRYSYYLIFLLMVDGINIVPELLRINDKFYQDNVALFFQPMRRWTAFPPVVDAFFAYSFVAPEKSLLFADRYHRIHHISRDEVFLLLGYPPERVLRLPIKYSMHHELFLPGYGLIYANAVPLRSPPWDKNNAVKMRGVTRNDRFIQLIARAEDILFKKKNNVFEISVDVGPKKPFLLIKSKDQNISPVIIVDNTISVQMAHDLYGEKSDLSQFTVVGFKIHSYCNRQQSCRLIY